MPNVCSIADLYKNDFFNCDNHIAYSLLTQQDLSIQYPDNAFAYYGQDANHIFYRLKDNTETDVALLMLTPETLCDGEYLRIGKIHTLFDSRRQGYAKVLYKIAANHNQISIISDRTLTFPGSFNIWQSLTKEIDDSFQVLFINSKNCNQYLYDKNIDLLEYWGYEETYLDVYKEDIENLEINFSDNIVDEKLYDFILKNLHQLQDRKNIRFILKNNVG